MLVMHTLLSLYSSDNDHNINFTNLTEVNCYEKIDHLYNYDLGVRNSTLHKLLFFHPFFLSI